MNIYDLSLAGDVFVDSKVTAALQEIDILFSTEQTELIGDVKYGMNFEQFLWQMNPSPTSLKKYISEQISLYTMYASQFDVMIDVSIVPGEYRNIYQVIIALRDEHTAPGKVNGFRIYHLR